MRSCRRWQLKVCNQFYELSAARHAPRVSRPTSKPGRPRVKLTMYLSDAILLCWFLCVCNGLKKGGDFRPRQLGLSYLVSYLQDLPPAGPLHLPEQHWPALVHAAPLGSNRHTGGGSPASESRSCNWNSRKSHWFKLKLCESCRLPSLVETW